MMPWILILIAVLKPMLSWLNMAGSMFLRDAVWSNSRWNEKAAGVLPALGAMQEETISGAKQASV